MQKHKMAEVIIKDTLQKRGLKYDSLCNLLGLKKNNFYKCMSGAKKLNTLEFLCVCAYLNLKVEDFKECY